MLTAAIPWTLIRLEDGFESERRMVRGNMRRNAKNRISALNSWCKGTRCDNGNMECQLRMRSNIQLLVHRNLISAPFIATGLQWRERKTRDKTHLSCQLWFCESFLLSLDGVKYRICHTQHFTLRMIYK